MELTDKKSQQIFDAIYKDTEAIFLLNKKEQTYEMLKGNAFWQELIGKTGSWSDLYTTVFIQNLVEQDPFKDNDYDQFNDEGFFLKERYQGTIIKYRDGKREAFGLYLVRVSEEFSGLIIQCVEEKLQRDWIELEKSYTIQEEYLFSMIVNLADDTCINPNTTEISAERQDYIQITYSDWRMKITNMFLESDRPLFLRMTAPEHIINTLEEQMSFGFEIQMMNMQGVFIWVRLRFTRMRGFSRENPCFVYTVQDIHEDMMRLLNQESTVQAIEEQNKRLQKADKEKTKYFSSMSHEIRTPINAILGMNEVILRESREENILSYARDIKSASKYLLSMVNDILDYSKIEAGKMEIVPVEYSTAEMIHSICNLVSIRLEQKDLQFHVKVAEDVPCKLYGDEIRISQVIVNLLTNSVKYTEKGSVTFSVETTKMENHSFALRVTVQDTGIGIRKEDQEKLFADYQRLDTERNRKIEGTGLGMSIVVGLLKQMDSQLEVESTYGEGSTFSFVLPQKIVDQTPIQLEKGAVAVKEDAQLTEIADVSQRRILIVDDNLMNLRVAKALLRPYQLEVDVANSGRQCLEKLQGASYDIIFLDHMMPEMDGVQTLQEIQKMEAVNPGMQVIALTANASPGARDEYRSFGFTDYLEKPLTSDALDHVIRRYLVD